MSFISNLLKSEDKKKLKDDSNVFLFDSDDESVTSELASQPEHKRKRKTSLLKRIRNAFDRESIIESDEETGTQPTQALSKSNENEVSLLTQPTQLQSIEKDQSITQPTQLKAAVPEEEPSKTQPTQLKGIFDEEEEDSDLQPKTQATQLRGVFDEADEDEILPVQESKESLSVTQPTQLKAVFDDEDEEFFGKIDAPPITSKTSTSIRAIFEESDDSLFDEQPEMPGSVNVDDVEPVAGTNEYNSDVSDFEIELDSDKENVEKLSDGENEVEEETTTLQKPLSQEFIMLSDDDDDDEFDSIKNRHNESAETKATTMMIQAHIARQQSLKNSETLKKKKKGMDVQDLFMQLKKKAVKQSQKTRVNLEVVEKAAVETADEPEIEQSYSDDSNAENENINIDSDYDGDEEPNRLSSDDDVFEHKEEEIFYGKKAMPTDTLYTETIPLSKESSSIDEEEENNTGSDSDGEEKEKRRLERARLRREALKQESNNNVENPFLAEEAEESETDEEDGPRTFVGINKPKVDEKVDDALHTSDEEMFDDDSDIENNEEDLRKLEREQQAKDEEELERQIQKTLKGERRGIDREEEFLDDDNDFEQDDEYIAYKKRQEAMEAKISKRMNKSKKTKINVLEGVNARISLPENKIGVLDKLAVTSTLSFLARDTTPEENKTIEENNDSDDDIMKKFNTKMAFSSTALHEDENIDDDQADSLMFIKSVKKIVKKPAVESEEMKFRLGVKTFTKNHIKNSHTKTISAGRDQYGFNKDGKREVPFLGKKRKADSKGKSFNYEGKKHKV